MPAPAEPPADDATPSAPAAEPRPARLQMADIARLANVSISTVSRALSHHPKLSAETRDRINELAKSLHYNVDAGARMMRGKAPATVALAFPYFPERRRHFKDPFFLKLVGSIGDALIDSGHQMLVVPVLADRFEELTLPYDTRQAIGTILLGQEYNHARINALAVRGTPFVVWGARLPDQLYCTVGSDNIGGGVQATEHLLAAGARRIAFFGNPRFPEMGQRHAGYVAAHRARGLEPDPALLQPVPFVTEVVASAAAQLPAPPHFDAVFACSDLMALTIIATLRSRGLRVPEDVRVVGFDDIGLAEVAHPPLTTVRQAIDTAGRTLVTLLLARLAGETIESVVLPTELVVRGTT